MILYGDPPGHTREGAAGNTKREVENQRFQDWFYDSPLCSKTGDFMAFRDEKGGIEKKKHNVDIHIQRVIRR